jgi:hypothetical protein
MSIIITNRGAPPSKENTTIRRYTVQINNGPVLAEFEHDWMQSLGLCLMAAAKAVEEKQWYEMLHECQNVQEAEVRE